MHPRQSAKIQALEAIGTGATDYRTFQAAASFGQIHPHDFVTIPGYRPGLRWANTYSSDPDAYAKDHRLSRKWAYENHQQANDILSPSLAIALMDHAVKYALGNPPRANQALWLMAVICGHFKNAEIMTVRENSSKGKACSVSLSGLADEIASIPIKNRVYPAYEVQ